MLIFFYLSASRAASTLSAPSHCPQTVTRVLSAACPLLSPFQGAQPISHPCTPAATSLLFPAKHKNRGQLFRTLIPDTRHEKEKGTTRHATSITSRSEEHTSE